jgi:hypothetical protein
VNESQYQEAVGIYTANISAFLEGLYAHHDSPAVVANLAKLIEEHAMAMRKVSEQASLDKSIGLFTIRSIPVFGMGEGEKVNHFTWPEKKEA